MYMGLNIKEYDAESAILVVITKVSNEGCYHVQYSKTCLKRPLKKKTKIGFQDRLSLKACQNYCRMLPLEHFVILSTFIKLLFVNMIFVLSIIEWQLKTSFTEDVVG